MDENKPIVYRQIPTTRHLFAKGGMPGMSYAIIPPEDLPQAEEAGYRQIQGARSFYIEGPHGKVAAIVVGRGHPMRGIPQTTFVCPLKVHKGILEKTGLKLGDGDGEGKSAQGSHAPEGREGHARVQNRPAPKRVGAARP